LSGSALINMLAGRFVLAGLDRMASRSPPPEKGAANWPSFTNP
jgi:hypothetical protein